MFVFGKITLNSSKPKFITVLVSPEPNFLKCSQPSNFFRWSCICHLHLPIVFFMTSCCTIVYYSLGPRSLLYPPIHTSLVLGHHMFHGGPLSCSVPSDPMACPRSGKRGSWPPLSALIVLQLQSKVIHFSVIKTEEPGKKFGRKLIVLKRR